MNIGIIAHNSKRTLIEDFCIAYKTILGKHDIYATGTTGRRIEEVTNLHVHKFLPGSIGGDKQFTEMIERNAMDMVIFFYNPNMIDPKDPDVTAIERTCDINNIPIATNIATAELLIMGLDRGDLDWRLSLREDGETTI
jgi:methylglyoxal synthase